MCSSTRNACKKWGTMTNVDSANRSAKQHCPHCMHYFFIVLWGTNNHHHPHIDSTTMLYDYLLLFSGIYYNLHCRLLGPGFSTSVSSFLLQSVFHLPLPSLPPCGGCLPPVLGQEQESSEHISFVIVIC